MDVRYSFSHAPFQLPRKGSACLNKVNTDVMDAITGDTIAMVDITSKEPDMVFDDLDIMPDDLLRTSRVIHPNEPFNEARLKSSSPQSMPDDTAAPSSPASPTPWI